MTGFPQYPQGEGFPPPPSNDNPAYFPGAAVVPPPLPVVRAFQLWVATVVISVIGIGLSILDWGSQKDAVVSDILTAARDAGTELTRAQAESFASTVFGVTIAVSALVTALLLFLAFRMKAGRNWARIILTVVGGIVALFAIFGLASGGLAAVSSLLQAGLIIAAIVFMFQGAASAYFAKR